MLKIFEFNIGKGKREVQIILCNKIVDLMFLGIQKLTEFVTEFVFEDFA